MSDKFSLTKTTTQGVKKQMNTRIATKVLAMAAIAASSMLSETIAAVAQPSAIFTVPVYGNKQLNLLTTPFTRPSIQDGVVTAQTLNVLTVSGVPAMTSGVTYILTIEDGDYIGLTAPITAYTASTVTIDATLPAGAILSNIRYSIRPDWTISTLFGPANATQIGSSTSYGNGDTIQVFNPVSQRLEGYYRYRTGTSQANYQYAWLSSAGVAADNARIPFGEGFIINKFSASTLNLRLSGELRQSRARKEVLGNSKLTLVANPNPFPLKLKNCGIIIGQATSVAGDNLHFLNPATGRFISYWKNSGNGGKWYDAAGNLAEETVIPAGSSVILQRKAAGGLTGKNAVRVNPIMVADSPEI